MAKDIVEPTSLPQNGQAQANPGFVANAIEFNDPALMRPEVPANLWNKVIGDPGTFRYGGYFREEYLAAFQDNLTRVDTIEEMRRGDATCAQALKAVKAPMLAASFDVTTESDDPKDQEICDFIKKNVFEMDRSFKDLLRQCFTYLDFGFAAFEQIYQIKEGKIWLKDIAPRIQASILRWKLNDGTRGIVQILRTDEAKNYYVEIPIRKCLVLTNDMEGDDITGMPVLRAAYKHYFYKNELYKIAGISAERYGVGIPMITLPDGSTTQDNDAAKSILQNLRSNETSFVVLPGEKWKMEILTPAGKSSAGEDIKDQIDHHDRMILSSILASFLALGSSDSGSFALSKDQHGFFLTHVQDRTHYFTDEFTKQVIKPLVIANFGAQKVYPKLTASHVGDIDKAAMAGWIKILTDAGYITPDLKHKEFINENFDLPRFSDEEKEQMEQDELDAEIDKLAPPADTSDQPAPDMNIDESSPEAPQEENQDAETK